MKSRMASVLASTCRWVRDTGFGWVVVPEENCTIPRSSALTAQGTAEALTLAARCGLDVERVRQVLMGGMASSRVLDLFGARMASRDFSAGIESRLYHKDLDIALNLAHQEGTALPAAAVTATTATTTEHD